MASDGRSSAGFQRGRDVFIHRKPGTSRAQRQALRPWVWIAGNADISAVGQLSSLGEPVLWGQWEGSDFKSRYQQREFFRSAAGMCCEWLSPSLLQKPHEWSPRELKVASAPHHSCSVPSWKLLSRSFRAWRRLSQSHQARAKAIAQNHRRLIRKSLRLLRCVLRLRETQQEATWGQLAEALQAWSFQEVSVL